MKSQPEPKPLDDVRQAGMTLFQSQQNLLFHEVRETYRKFLADKDALEKAAAEEAAASPKKSGGGGGKKKKKKKKK